MLVSARGLDRRHFGAHSLDTSTRFQRFQAKRAATRNRHGAVSAPGFFSAGAGRRRRCPIRTGHSRTPICPSACRLAGHAPPGSCRPVMGITASLCAGDIRAVQSWDWPRQIQCAGRRPPPAFHLPARHHCGARRAFAMRWSSEGTKFRAKACGSPRSE